MSAITRTQLLTFMREERYAVQASVSASGTPQAAIVGIVVSDRFEVFFDTLGTSRKATNLRRNSAAALVIGPAAAGSERTVQVEGVTDEPEGADLARPTWLRYSDFSVDPPTIVEFQVSDLT